MLVDRTPAAPSDAVSLGRQPFLAASLHARIAVPCVFAVVALDRPQFFPSHLGIQKPRHGRPSVSMPCGAVDRTRSCDASCVIVWVNRDGRDLRVGSNLTKIRFEQRL